MIKKEDRKRFGCRYSRICTEVTRIDRLEIMQYLSNLIRLDAIILNEDRHLNNVSFIKSINGDYSLCPVFDNGGSFLSDENDYR